MNRKVSKIRSRGAAVGMFLPALAACLLSFGALQAGSNDESIENTKLALEKWVETQRIISQEKRDLALAREMLTERIELVGREIKSLRERISQAQEGITETDAKRLKLVEENDKLKRSSESLAIRLGALEERTKKLLAHLPNPIRERVKPLSQRLPDGTAETRLSTSERFQNVVGILNEIDRFNREISVTSEVSTLKDGSSVEVTTLYIGISRGYYVNADRTLAGVGAPSDAGWIWTPANEVAGQVSDTIAILRNEKIASFVQLPVTIK
ncbi:MAG TPA: DUF3450 family protein [Sedimentisphaerales bacterium]|nr:DUF3450 family protein [Sedimentisphaerales bacterium]